MYHLHFVSPYFRGNAKKDDDEACHNKYDRSELEAEERHDVGPAWGDLVHRLLEKALREPELEDEALLSYARWIAFEQPELDSVLEQAVETVRKVMETDFWQGILKREERLTEVPFGVKSEDEKSLVFGVLDLATKTGDSWQIVDYKTDVTPMEHLIRRYASQIVPYAQHWARLTGEEVDYV